MNLKFKELAKEIYSQIKEESKWNKKDLELIEKISKMVKAEVARVKRADKYQEKIGKTITLEKPQAMEMPDPNIALTINFVEPKEEDFIGDPNIQIDELDETTGDFFTGKSIHERLLFDEDQAVTEKLKKELVKEEIIEETEVHITDISKVKRYQVNITTYGIPLLKKPNMQLFLTDNTEEKDFKTDKIIRRTKSYVCFIDTDDRELITPEIYKTFGQCQFTITKVENDYIPPVYKGIWQNKTIM